jgi:hypothetical protein
MTACLLSLPPSPVNMKTYSCHVYVDSELTMQHQALISSKVYVQPGAVLSVSYLLFKSVLKMVNYTLWEYADMHLILGEACGNGAAAVRWYT